MTLFESTVTRYENKYHHDTCCRALECCAIGTEFVKMKVGNDKVINIWVCKKCALCLGDK